VTDREPVGVLQIVDIAQRCYLQPKILGNGDQSLSTFYHVDYPII
jgi:hypothetical protein